MKPFRALLLSLVCLVPSIAAAEPLLAIDLPEAQRVRYRNPDGSCVQCSIGMLGVHQNCPAAELLLWKSDHGKAVRGGSTSSRVANYAKARGIPVFNLTEDTIPWLKWACKTGRGAAITCFKDHMQTLVGYDETSATWYVCNNNSPAKIDAYSDAEFRRYHLRGGGGWAVILDLPPPPPKPAYTPWWN